MKEFDSLTMVVMETGKDTFSVIIATIELNKYKARKNLVTSKMYIFRKIIRKFKNVTFLHFMTIFHSCALKIKPVELKER